MYPPKASDDAPCGSPFSSCKKLLQRSMHQVEQSTLQNHPLRPLHRVPQKARQISENFAKHCATCYIETDPGTQK